MIKWLLIVPSTYIFLWWISKLLLCKINVITLIQGKWKLSFPLYKCDDINFILGHVKNAVIYGT